MTGSADHSISARNVRDIHAIVVDLKADSETLLFILVSADRSINRIGSGTFGNKNRDMFIGMTPPGHSLRMLRMSTSYESDVAHVNMVARKIVGESQRHSKGC